MDSQVFSPINLLGFFQSNPHPLLDSITIISLFSRVAEMDSEPDVLLYSPVFVRINSTSSSSSSDNIEVEDATNRWIFNWGEFFSCRNFSEWNMICLFLVVNFLFVASHHLLVNLYGPQNVWLGPNSSILAETSSIFVKSIKVKELEYSTSGLQLDGFYRSPPLDVLVNWSTYQFLSISHDAYKGWPYHFNRGTHLNISYRVKPQGSAVQLLINQGVQGSSQSLYENAFRDTAWSWNLIQGSGVIELEISKSSSYYLTVANLNRKDVEVELNIDVRAVLYDTKQSFYNCTFSNGECTFNVMSLVGNSVVVTSPAPSQGVSIEDEWYIRFSYEPRWIAYVILFGVVMGFALVAMQFCNKLQCCGGGVGHQTENDPARRRLLADKDDNDSCNEPFANDDADLEENIGNDGEASNSSKRLCAICYDAQRDCFFLPCGHCVSCYQCGTKIARTDGSCPICRRRLKKVKRIYKA